MSQTIETISFGVSCDECEAFEVSAEYRGPRDTEARRAVEQMSTPKTCPACGVPFQGTRKQLTSDLDADPATIDVSFTRNRKQITVEFSDYDPDATNSWVDYAESLGYETENVEGDTYRFTVDDSGGSDG